MVYRKQVLICKTEFIQKSAFKSMLFHIIVCLSKLSKLLLNLSSYHLSTLHINCVKVNVYALYFRSEYAC